MVYLASVVVLCISFSQSILCMEAACAQVSGMKIKEKVRNSLPQVKSEFPSLRALCLQFFQKKQLEQLENQLSYKYKIDDRATTLLPFTPAPVTTLQAEVSNRIKRECAVPLFSIFGKQYVPQQTKLTLPFTRVSLDKQYVFEFDERLTKIYKILDNGQIDLVKELDGKFVGLSQESRWLLINCNGVHRIFELPSFELVLSLSESFDSKKDLFVFNPKGHAFIIRDCINLVKDHLHRGGYFTKMRYKAQLAKLQNISPEFYIFDVDGAGIQLKYLLCGITCNENGEDIIYFPRKFSFVNNGEYVLINNRSEATYNRADRTYQDDAVLLLNREANFMELPQEWKSSAFVTELSSDGCSALVVQKKDITSEIQLLYVPYLFPTKIFKPQQPEHAENSFVAMAISNDGRFILALHDATWIWDEYYEPSKDPEYHAIWLIDTENAQSVLISAGDPPIRHFGFSPDGTSFFLLRDHYYHYCLPDFAPLFSKKARDEITLSMLLNAFECLKSRILSCKNNVGLYCDKNWYDACYYGTREKPVLGEDNYTFYDFALREWQKHSETYNKILTETTEWYRKLVKILPEVLSKIEDPKIITYLKKYFDLDNPEALLERFNKVSSSSAPKTQSE